MKIYQFKTLLIKRNNFILKQIFDLKDQFDKLFKKYMALKQKTKGDFK